MNLSTRLRKLETATAPEDGCRDCRQLHRSIILHNEEPEPEPERCARCGRVIPCFVVRLIGVDPDDV
jgi:hypothetical protein